MSDHHRKISKAAKKPGDKEDDTKPEMTEEEKKKLAKKKQADAEFTDDENMAAEEVKDKKKEKLKKVTEIVKETKIRETSCDMKIKEEEERKKKKEQKKAERLKLQMELEARLKEEEEWERNHQKELKRLEAQNRKIEDSISNQPVIEEKKKVVVERQPRRLPSKGMGQTFKVAGTSRTAGGDTTDNGTIYAEDIDDDVDQQGKSEVIIHKPTQSENANTPKGKSENANTPKEKKLIQPQVKFGVAKSSLQQQPLEKPQLKPMQLSSPKSLHQSNPKPQIEDTDSDISLEKEKPSKAPIKSQNNGNDWTISNNDPAPKQRLGGSPFAKGKFTGKLTISKAQPEIDSDEVNDWDS